MIGTLKRRLARHLEHRFPLWWLKFRIWRRDRHFEREFFTLGPLCPPGRIAVDVGGNAGEYSYWLSLHAARVVVYEPNPGCHPAISRLKRPNIRLRSVALSDSSGTARLVFQSGNSGIGSIAGENPIFALENEPGYVQLTVQTVRLDEEALDPVGLMKIDVEGHEAAVIAGAMGLILRDRPRLMIEVEERHRACAHDRVRALLEPAGYRRFRQEDGRLRPLPWDVDARSLQTAPPGTPGYVNNFFFFHETDPLADLVADPGAASHRP